MKSTTINVIKYLYVIIGIVIGCWHLRIGMLAIFLFRENEQILSWLIVLSGPLLTLPSIIIGIKKLKIAALCLLCGSIVSLVIMIITEGFGGEHILQFIIKITMPMLLLATIGYVIGKRVEENKVWEIRGT